MTTKMINGDTYETVNTHALQIGDVIRAEGGEGYWLVQGNGRATWLRRIPCPQNR